jgi:hypothetical protein
MKWVVWGEHSIRDDGNIHKVFNLDLVELFEFSRID